MNPRSYLPMRILAFVCTFFSVSAFVNLQPTIGGRLCPLASTAEESNIPEKLMEEVWRYVKKPLISVGGKGATSKHGNSLRQLLDDHTVVKVKVNTKSFGTLDKAYETLRDLAIESGASADIELIQMRDKDRTIMFGLPGTLENVENGSFPPPPPPPPPVNEVEAV
mmetsp:Transcript_1199/g.2601  ORF Transcript_1199/g.2601 Transcript_1199/m.2601 type:complete len:166 (-) Transcript_1199:1436-1933(-)